MRAANNEVMTKTEAREYLKRCREGVREAERALRENDAEALVEACMEIGGSAGTIETSLCCFGGVRGIGTVDR